MRSASQPLRVGTDYSGMETPIIALRALGVRYRHLFSSDVCPKARLVIQEKFEPERLFEDATKRLPGELPEKLDLYVAGFPCQVFSSISPLAGHHRNPVRPLKHFLTCVETIEKCEPSVFILENVPRLVTTAGGHYFRKVQKVLGGLKGYRISYSILNARDYGSPQNRRRLFIVGSTKGLIRPPAPVLPPRNFESLMERGATRAKASKRSQAILDRCARRFHGPVFMNRNLVTLVCHGSPHPPCLTAVGRGVYWSKRKIFTTLREDMRLQGIPDSFSFPSGISETWGRKLVGNAMSVDVLKPLLREALR